MTENYTKVAQYFTPERKELDAVQLRVAKPSDEIKVYIQTDNNGTPSGNTIGNVSSVRIYYILARIIKHSCTYIKVGREGNENSVWDPFPWINLLPSHPLNTRISTFWTYINVPRITGELVYWRMQGGT